MRKEIKGFSNGSRRRFMDLLAKVGGDEVPLFVTLTFPDHFPRDAALYKRHLNAFFQRLERHCPGVVVVWKLEFETRKSGENKGQVAPHYHLFIYNIAAFEIKEEASRFCRVHKASAHKAYPFNLEIRDGEGRLFHMEPLFSVASAVACERVFYEEENPDLVDVFRKWVSRNWYDVVGTGDERHFKAGTKVEQIRSIRGVFFYASKNYIAKAVECSEDLKPGRFWGVKGRKNIRLGKREYHSLTWRQTVVLLRLLRRHRRANTSPERRCRHRTNYASAKSYSNAAFWLDRLDQLLGENVCQRKGVPK